VQQRPFDAYLHAVLKSHVIQSVSLNPASGALLIRIKDWRMEASEILPFLLNNSGQDEFIRRVEEHFADRTLQDPYKGCPGFSDPRN
jgi:hypothetical protein